MRKNNVLLLSLVALFLIWALSSCVIYCSNCGCHFNSKYEREVQLETDMCDGLTFAAQTSHSYLHIWGIDENHCYVTAHIRVQADTEEKAKEVAEKVTVDLEKSANRVTTVVQKPKVPYKYQVFVSYEVKLPRKTSVELETTHDPIECRNLLGNVVASTTHAPIVCENIVGNLNLTTTHDPIRLSHITGQIKARTSHDPIEAEYITGPLDLQTSHDRIRCTNLNTERLKARTTHDNVEISFTSMNDPEIDADISTSHGHIVFHLPDGFKGSLSMSTSHGKVRTGVPLTVKGEISEKFISGTIGEGKGTIRLKTTHGSINLK